ncbi:MAG: hypothetical protein GF401_00465 [Chitinivibrionales bacterium]|nr:hypothetical protein [Chitinivibrionales bacterium]
MLLRVTKKECVTTSESEQKYKALKHYNTVGHAHELTFCCYHRYDYFSDSIACEIFLTELEKSRKEHEFELWAYVLTPNHVHLLIWPRQNTYDISRILLEFHCYRHGLLFFQRFGDGSGRRQEIIDCDRVFEFFGDVRRCVCVAFSLAHRFFSLLASIRLRLSELCCPEQ